MKKILTALFFLSAAQAYSEDARDMRLMEIKGHVWIKEPEGQWQLIPEGSLSVPIEEGESIKTGPSSEATLQIDQINIIELDSETEFEVSAAQKGWTKFRLGLGRIFAKIEEKIAQNQRRMTFTTNQAVLAVRGTEFSLEEPGEGGKMEGGMAVFEGEIETEFPNIQDKPTVRVGKDQEVDFSRSGAPPRVRALKRFAAFQKRMTLFRKKHAHLRGQWRKISTERRKAIRSKIQKRMKQRVEQKRQSKIHPEGPRPKTQGQREERREDRSGKRKDGPRRPGPGPRPK